MLSGMDALDGLYIFFFYSFLVSFFLFYRVDSLSLMANRIIKMRERVLSHLTKLQTPGSWTHITSQIGMFSYTGLSVAQVAEIKSRFHVYMTDNGRVSMAGLNEGNVERFAEAIDYVVRNIK